MMFWALKLFYLVVNVWRHFGPPVDAHYNDSVIKVWGEFVAIPTACQNRYRVLDVKSPIQRIINESAQHNDLVTVIVGESGSGKSMLSLSLCVTDPRFFYWDTYRFSQPVIPHDVGKHVEYLVIDEAERLNKSQLEYMSNWVMGGGKVVLCFQRMDELPDVLLPSSHARLLTLTSTRPDNQQYGWRVATATLNWKETCGTA